MRIIGTPQQIPLPGMTAGDGVLCIQQPSPIHIGATDGAGTAIFDDVSLRQVNRVGGLTSLLFVLTIVDPHRIKEGRNIGAYAGLCSARRQSGDLDLEMRINREGDGQVRRCFVQCAQQILGPHGEDCDLRRRGLELAKRGGKKAYRNAIVAVARKLAVLLLAPWRTGEVYEPLRNAKPRGERVPASASLLPVCEQQAAPDPAYPVARTCWFEHRCIQHLFANQGSTMSGRRPWSEMARQAGTARSTI
jgi:hypothetical protein